MNDSDFFRGFLSQLYLGLFFVSKIVIGIKNCNYEHVAPAFGKIVNELRKKA